MNKEHKRKVVEAVWRKDKYRCCVCGDTEKLTAHHLVPTKKGGEWEVWNMVTVCKSCHNIIHGHGDLNHLSDKQRDTILRFQKYL